MKTLVWFLFSKGVQTAVYSGSVFLSPSPTETESNKTNGRQRIYADEVERGTKGRRNDFAALFFRVQENALCRVMMLEQFGRCHFSLRVESRTTSLKMRWNPFIRGCRETEVISNFNVDAYRE